MYLGIDHNAFVCLLYHRNLIKRNLDELKFDGGILCFLNIFLAEHTGTICSAS